MKIDSWDLPKTKGGVPKIHVDNDIEVNTDALEATLTTLDTRFDNTIGNINNLSDLGSGSDVLKSGSLAVMSSGNARMLTCSDEGYLNVDLQAGTLNIGDVDISSLPETTNSHLAKLTTLDTRFDNTIGAINNLSNLGAGSDALKSASLGIMASGNARILSCSNDGDLNVNITSGAITGFSTSTKQDTIIGYLDGVEGKLDTIETSLTSMEGKMDTDNSVYDSQLSKLTDIETNTDNIDSKLDHLSGDLDSIHTDLASGVQGKLDHLSDNLDTLQNSLGNIDTGIDVLEACVGSNKVNVNISSGAITGFSTSSKQDIVIGHLDGVEGKLDTIELTLTSMEGKMDTDNAVYDSQLSKLTDIETNTDNIDSKLDHLSGDLDIIHTDLASGIQGKLDHISDNLDTLENSLAGIETKMDTDNVVYDSQLTKLTEIDTAIDTIDGVLDNILVQNTASEVHLSNLDSVARLNISTVGSKLSDNELSTSIDCTNFSEICIGYPTSQNSDQLFLFVQGSLTAGGTYFTFASLVLKQFDATLAGSGNTQYFLYGTGTDQYNAIFIPCLYPFIKIENQSGVNFTDTDDIRIIGR